MHKNKDPDTKVDANMHRQYRSGVGSLLYLLKHSQPELSNPIRELSKAMQEPNDEHVKEMYRVIKWVIETPCLGLKIKSQVEYNDYGKPIWRLRGICDSTWGSDKDDGRSVTVYILYLMEVPIAWKSKTQSHVTLSSSEAEYIALSELVKEVLYVKQLLKDIGIDIELLVKIYIDNIGAIQMARNNIGTAGARHVNIRWHFVRDLIGTIIELRFVHSDLNTADIMTKNATKAECDRHVPNLVEELPYHLQRKYLD